MKNLEIETVAVKLVLEHEKKEGRHIFKEKYKGCGWDVCSSDGINIRYIEIKSSKSKKLTGRWIEKAGYEHIKNNPNFWIYAVVNCKEDGSGNIIPINQTQLKNLGIVEEIKYILKIPNYFFNI